MNVDGDGQLGVVILTYGANRTVDHLLTDLQAQGVGPERVVIVHNGPQDHRLPSASPISLINVEGNGGYPVGMNIGVRYQLHRGSNLVLLLTQGVRLPKPSLERMLDAAARFPRVGVLGPEIRRDDGRIHSTGGFISAEGMIFHREHELDAAIGVADCDWVDGAAMLVRAAVFRTVGLFDERYFMYCEDVEFGLRATSAGFACGIAAGARAIDPTSASLRAGANAYLTMRNGLDVAGQFTGTRGVLHGLWRIGRHTVVRNVRTLAQRGESSASRRMAAQRLTAVLPALTAYALRRFGPPPAWLPGMGDVVAAPPRRAVVVDFGAVSSDDATAPAGQLAEALGLVGPVLTIGPPGGDSDIPVTLAGGLRPLRLLRLTGRRDELQIVGGKPGGAGSSSRALAYLSLGMVARRRRVKVSGPTFTQGPFTTWERIAQRWWLGAVN